MKKRESEFGRARVFPVFFRSLRLFDVRRGKKRHRLSKMTRYYCDYCDAHLTHDSVSAFSRCSATEQGDSSSGASCKVVLFFSSSTAADCFFFNRRSNIASLFFNLNLNLFSLSSSPPPPNPHPHLRRSSATSTTRASSTAPTSETTTPSSCSRRPFPRGPCRAPAAAPRRRPTLRRDRRGPGGASPGGGRPCAVRPG